MRDQVEIVCCDSRNQSAYISFCQNIYANNPFFRDSALTNVLRSILYGWDPFFREMEIIPVMACSNGEVLAACMYMANPELPGLLQLSYFEAVEGCRAAVDLLVATARNLCVKRGLNSIVAGLDNNAGILTDHFGCAPCYGTRYNPAYYQDYFRKHASREYMLASYLIDLAGYNLEREQKILNRIAARFTCRAADWRHLGREAAVYTYLKNRCFTGQPFFTPGSTEMNYRMFSSYQSLVSGENLLILERDGAPVGYLLWFPDYNQLLAPGAVMSPETIRKFRIHGRAIDKFIVSEIGVLPEYQGTGAILALFDRCLQATGGRYGWCETGWILAGNMKSKGFGIRWAGAEYKHYKIFEIGL